MECIWLSARALVIRDWQALTDSWIRTPASPKIYWLFCNLLHKSRWRSSKLAVGIRTAKCGVCTQCCPRCGVLHHIFDKIRFKTPHLPKFDMGMPLENALTHNTHCPSKRLGRDLITRTFNQVRESSHLANPLSAPTFALSAESRCHTGWWL
jgi:hypothetical protein